MSFKDQVAEDNEKVFLDLDEFGEIHNLNGVDVPCIIQSPTARERFLGLKYSGYEGISGRVVVVHVKTADLEEVPQSGQVFTLDDETMLVDECVDDMGIASITLHQNVGVVGGGMDAY